MGRRRAAGGGGGPAARSARRSMTTSCSPRRAGCCTSASPARAGPPRDLVGGRARDPRPHDASPAESVPRRPAAARGAPRHAAPGSIRRRTRGRAARPATAAAANPYGMADDDPLFAALRSGARPVPARRPCRRTSSSTTRPSPRSPRSSRRPRPRCVASRAIGPAKIDAYGDDILELVRRLRWSRRVAAGAPVTRRRPPARDLRPSNRMRSTSMTGSYPIAW